MRDPSDHSPENLVVRINRDLVRVESFRGLLSKVCKPSHREISSEEDNDFQRRLQDRNPVSNKPGEFPLGDADREVCRSVHLGRNVCGNRRDVFLKVDRTITRRASREFFVPVDEDDRVRGMPNKRSVFDPVSRSGPVERL
jgi:hypothetical protein